MNLFEAIRSPALAEIVFNTALHSFVFSVIVAGAIASSKRISPYIASGALFTALLVLILLPLIEINSKSINAAWWRLSMVDSQSLPSATQLVSIARPITSKAAPINHSSPTIWQQITESSTTVTNSVGILWGFGVLGMLAKLLFSFSRLEQLRSRLIPIKNERVVSIWKSLREKQGIKRSISIAQINAACSPFAFGFWRPHIVMPTEMVSNASPQEIEDALLHEYNHIANRDLWLAVLQKITLTFYWWNPIIKWLEQQFSLSREKLCDIAVVAHTGKPKAYASTLIALADRLNGFTPLPDPTARMATSFSLLEERIKNIATNRINMKTPRIKRLTWTACSAAMLVGLLTIGIKTSWASPQQALATLKSNGSETVQLSIVDNTIEVTVRTPEGKTKSVRLPVGDKAKAAELLQLIGNIDSAPHEIVAEAGLYQSGRRSKPKYQSQVSESAAPQVSLDVYSNAAESTIRMTNPSGSAVISTESVPGTGRIRSSNKPQPPSSLTFSEGPETAAVFGSPTEEAFSSPRVSSSAPALSTGTLGRSKPTRRTSTWTSTASSSSGRISSLNPVIPVEPVPPVVSLPTIASSAFEPNVSQPTTPARPQKPRRYREGQVLPKPALAPGFLGGMDAPLSEREQMLIEQSRVLSEAIEVLRKRVDRFGVPQLNDRKPTSADATPSAPASRNTPF
ncbi:M56 family metallopeptidase [Verrucomicrobia bacterium]|nr:M56 family metallopeptidase [Verrucomicrobiota bacterium]MDA7657622.1 M56 family metallopeptidase [Verrucomicrobiota bacterium]